MEEYNRKPPKKEENPVREWISDNLRYLILAAVIIVIALAVLFIVRGVLKKKNGASSEAEKVSESTVSSVKETSSVASSSSGEGVIADAALDVTALVEGYFDSLNNCDSESAAGYVDGLDEEDRADIEEGRYNKNYSDITVYEYEKRNGIYSAVLVSYCYNHEGFTEKIPGLTEYCIIRGEDGTLKIASEAVQQEQQELLSEALGCENGQALIEHVKEEFEKVCEENPELAKSIR